ncbi:MAG: Hsp20/alpha crystallin family protein [Pseudomonadota bacterium]
MMPGLILWKNQEMSRLKRDIDRLFERVCDDFRIASLPHGERELPFIDLSESEENLAIKAELPGMDPEDLDISINEDILTIKGEIEQVCSEENENIHRTERTYRVFSRSLQLPCKVKMDEIEASYKKGILRITMPKCKPESSQGIKIKIK